MNLDSIRIPSPPMGKPPSPSTTATMESPGTMNMNAPPSPTEEDAQAELRTLVEKLVAQVMPSEMDNIDELLDEYKDREAELLDTLTSMGQDSDVSDESELSMALDESSSEREMSKILDDTDTNTMPAPAPNIVSQDEKQVYKANAANKSEAIRGSPSVEGGDNHDDRSQNKKQIAAVATAEISDLSTDLGPAASTAITTKPNEKSTASQHPKMDEKNTSKMTQAEIAGRKAANRAMSRTPSPTPSPSDIETGSSISNNEEKKRKSTETRRKNRRRMCILVVVLIVLFLAGIGIALGILFGSPKNNKGGDVVLESNGNEGTELIQQGDVTPPVNGDIVPAITKSPTQTPTISLLDYNDGYDANAPLSACNSIPKEKIQSLGVESLQGNYPKMALDGDTAVIALGTGNVAFYDLNPATNRWERGEVFGTLQDIGTISSVAISGNVAVIGAPYASTGLRADLEGPLETGAFFIYERTVEPGGGDAMWRQSSGAMVPDEYKSALKDKYHKASFGVSVDVDKDLIVVGAPQENNSRGSITVFKKNGGTSTWDQVRRLYPEKLCGEEFFGYSVQIYKDLIAASADCSVNIVLYKFDRSDDTIKLSQKLPYIHRQWGTVSSISMSWDHLVYSTVSGGLFFFAKSNKDDTSQYFLSKKMNFDFKSGLHDYPLSLDGNMLVLGVANDIFVYTQDTDGEWKRESIVLESKGNFAGYIGAPVALSGGHLMVADKREVNNHDFTVCARKSKAPSPFPTFSPTTMPTITPGSPTCIDVHIVFDNYPSDTSWEITDLSDDFVMAKSPIFDESLQDQTRRVCLAGGNYAFTIADKYADGMCCQWGQGSYNVTSDRDDVIVEGGEYGADERTTFTMPYDPENPFVAAKPPTAKPTTPVPDPGPAATTSTPTQLPTPKPAAAAMTPAPTPQPTPLPTPTPTEQGTSPPGADTCYNLDVSVSLDQYATDTTWEIILQGQNAPIATSNQYEASMALGPVPLQTVCLPDGMYDFIIYDVYGDGMCCDWGQGSYQLAFGSNIVASGGEFGQSEKVTFATPAESVPVSLPTPTPLAECYNVFVNLILDRYPSDTSWDISQGDNIVAASQPFPADTTTDEQELCLPPGDYVFTIYDVYLDGMCCQWGDGSYSLTTNTNEVIGEGGEFGASESTEFSLPTAAI